jgi:hypothetical protein
LTDPLLLLAEVAASPPSNLTNDINPNDQTGTTIHTQTEQTTTTVMPLQFATVLPII